MATYSGRVISVYLLAYLFVGTQCDKQDFHNLMRTLGRNSTSPHYRPGIETGTPVNVGLSVYVIDIHTLSQENGQLSLDCYVRTYWNNPSLIFPNDTRFEKINLSSDNAERYIWMPDIFLVNARETQQHRTFKEDGSVSIWKNGNVKRSSKLSFTVSCLFDLSFFPFDNQECSLKFESYSGSAADLNLTWKGSIPFFVSPEMVQKTKAFKYSNFQTSKITEMLLTGSYERLTATFSMKRSSGHYIVLYYLPTTFLVILGGLIFWLPLASLLEKTFYGAFLFLTGTVFVTACQIQTPSVGYLKAIDVWCVGCLTFLFVAVVEVIVLHLLRTKYTQHDTSSFHQMKEEETQQTSDTVNLTTTTTSSVFFRFGKVLPYMDLALKVTYPVVFVLFIIAYAGAYH